jgi:hypothetical protein
MRADVAARNAANDKRDAEERAAIIAAMTL